MARPAHSPSRRARRESHLARPISRNRFDRCNGVFAHSTKNANFIFYDGHVKTKKWLSTLYPVNQNNWVLDPNPDPANLKVVGVNQCNFAVPPGPGAPVFQTPQCLGYQ